MYEAYFGLHLSPFAQTVDSRLFYPSPHYNNIFTSLLSAIRAHKGLIVLTGEMGTGKTSLLHFVADSLEETAYSIPFHAAPPTFESLLWSLCHYLDLRVDVHNTTAALEEVIASLRARSFAGETIVLFIDEAQNLDQESFACLAHILASEGLRGKLLQIVLFGTSELTKLLAQPELQPLRQRLAVQLRLAPLVLEEVELFIRHRLRVAGWTRPDLFSPEAIQKIIEYSDAIPYRVNALCHGALAVAFTRHQPNVSAGMIEEIAQAQEQQPDDQGSAASTTASLLESVGQRPKPFVLDLPSPQTPPHRYPFKPISASLLAASFLVLLVLSSRYSWFGVEGASRSELEADKPTSQTDLSERFTEPSRISKLFGSMGEVFALINPLAPPQTAKVGLETRQAPTMTTQPAQGKKGESRKLNAAERARRRRNARAQLARLGISVNPQALVNSVEEGDTHLTSLLLRAGVSPNTSGEQGWTALMLAAQRDLADSVGKLLARGAKVDVKDEEGRTALMHAARTGSRASVETLLQKGADPNAIDNAGRTALTYALRPTEDTEKRQTNVQPTASKEQINKQPTASADDYRATIDLLRRAGAIELGGQ